MSGLFPRVSRRTFAWCDWVGVLALTACSPATETAPGELLGDELVVDAGMHVDAGARSDAALGAANARPLAACAALGGDAPRTIGEVVDRINALPAPGTLLCFVASLPRPLSLVASSSPSSAQPSSGRNNPRIFIVSGTLSMSVVPDGTGRNLLEFGEYVTPLRSTKGELAFPLTRPVAHDQPYQDPPDEQTVTLCGLCHTGQTPHPTITGAFVSDALRPARTYEMTLADVQKVRADCDTLQSNTPRCEMLRALFDYGEVKQGAFDEAIKQGF